MEVVVLEGSIGPDFADHFREGGPEVEDGAVRFNAPLIEFSEELFCDTAAIEPRDGFEIEDSNLDCIPCDLFKSATPSGHIFIDREISDELELGEDSREIVLRSQTLFPPIDGGFGPCGIKASDQSFRDSSEHAVILNHASHSFRKKGLRGPLIRFNP
jgi:hypothetical protein